MTLIGFNEKNNGGGALMATRGRAIKFTPERMDQIRNLVERGTHRDEIAKIIGCTVGSLQVTCSRAGISLRSPRHGTPMMLPRQALPLAASDGGREGKSDGKNEGIAPEPTLRLTASDFMCVLRVGMHGRTHDIPVPLTGDIMVGLALLGAIRGVGAGQLIADIISDAVRES